MQTADLRSEDEQLFVARLREGARGWGSLGITENDTQVWVYETPEGDPWLLVSVDLCRDGSVERTLRVDFSEAGVVGGWSPSCLNWDAEMTAREAGINIQPPDGLLHLGQTESPEHLAVTTLNWIERHIVGWGQISPAVD